MDIIDAHAHLLNLPNYLENLIKTMENVGISKCCLSGLGKQFGGLSNEDIEIAFKNYPEKIIGTYYIRPGISNPDEIDTAYSKGFKIMKVTIPTKPYDDISLYPLWERAQELQMPVLYHTGIVTILIKKSNDIISAWNMHPMRLESISNSFPKLKMIIAHFGVHWNNDAAEILRMRNNVYSDITGEPNGWRVRADRVGLEKWLWWDGAFKKLVFGTDVHYSKIPIILNQDKKRFEKYQLDINTKKLFFSENISKLLNLN